MPLAEALEFAACTDPGRVRPQNEDSLAFDAASGFALLADGMGGYQAGEVASQLAVSLVAAGLKAGLAEAQGQGSAALASLLRQQIEHANAEIYRQSMAQAELHGMGTTLVVALFHDHQAIAAHVGDSRLYRLRGDACERLTRDHTVLQERLERGEPVLQVAGRLLHKGLLTRALGVDPDVAVELGSFDAVAGDVFLLCSDGLTDMLEEAEIGQVLAAYRADLPGAAQQLVNLANDYGGFDNVSVVVVKIS